MYGEFLQLAVEMAREAGKIQRDYFRGGDLAIRTKSNDSDVVTRADRESEELIVRTLSARYPDHAILGEEGGSRGPSDSPYRWVVDPLDGTTNYSQGLPLFCVSIALEHRGETVAGVVYAPWLDELYTATLRGGAWLTTRGDAPQRLAVSAKQGLSTAVVATGFPYDKERNPDNNASNVARILPHVRDIRRMGSAAYDLCCVAAGLLDGFWELGLHEWDVAAGNLIVREAGGVVRELRPDRGVSILAGSERIVERMGQYVR